jgi:ADP-ribose pyrophosphatase YjhB (NUDIX family)
MTLIDTLIHPDIRSTDAHAMKRVAARAIVLHGEDILLLYTRRYDDFSFPGGGVNEEEDLEAGLRRELIEETGARNVGVVRHYGLIDEYRPYHKPEFDVLYMRSHFFVCTADRELGSPLMESYETANGMTPQWINIHQAISHNEALLAGRPPTMGLSVQRETLMLKHVARDLL